MKQQIIGIAILIIVLSASLVFGGEILNPKIVLNDTIKINPINESCITRFKTGQEVQYIKLVQQTDVYKNADINKSNWGGYSKGVIIDKVCGSQIYGSIVFVTQDFRNPHNKQLFKFNITMI